MTGPGEGLGLREEKRMDSWQAGGDSGDEDEELKDFRYGGKDATIFLVDCSPKMHLRSLENVPAFRSISNIITWFFKDLLHLFMSGFFLGRFSGFGG